MVESLFTSNADRYENFNRTCTNVCGSFLNFIKLVTMAESLSIASGKVVSKFQETCCQYSSLH